MSGNHFFKTDLILASGNSFYIVSGNHFFSIASYIFREVLHPGQWKHIFQSRRKSTVLLRTFFPASGNHYLNSRENYLKLLSLLLTTIFFNFSNISANVISFSSSKNVFLNKISIADSGDQFSVYLKQYSFISTFLSVSGNPIFENKFIPAKLIFWLVETILSSIFRHFCQ